MLRKALHHLKQGTFIEVLTNRFSVKKIIHKYQLKKWEQISKTNDFVWFNFQRDLKLKLYTDSILSRSIFFKNFEKEELRFFSKYIKKDFVVFDIGANIGLHSLYASKLVGSNGKVFSFEPVKKTYERLKENVEQNNINNIYSYNIALSDQNGKETITTSLDGFDAWNSIAGNQKIIGENFSEETIIMRTIDDFVKEHCSNIKIDFIKIDTEGWELNVLKGAKDYLTNNDPILMVEYALNVLENFDRKLEDIYDVLTDYGYNLYRYNHKRDSFTKVERGVEMRWTNIIASKDINNLKSN